MKTNTILWAVSLILIGVVSVVWTCFNIAGVLLPNFVVKIFEMMDRAAVLILVYTTVKKVRE